MTKQLCGLNTAINGLVKANATVSKTELNKAIILAESISNTGYTSASWTAVQTALANAKTINSNTSATQSDVDNATNSVNTAIDGLVKSAVKEGFYPVTVGVRIDTANGYEVDAGSYSSTDFIPVKGTTLYNSTKRIPYWVWYDSNKKYISGSSSSMSATSPSGAAYLRVSNLNINVVDGMIDVAPDGSAAGNVYPVTKNVRISTSTGADIDDAGYVATDYIPVVAGQAITTDVSASYWLWYSDAKVFFTKNYTSTGQTVPSNAAFLRLSTTNANIGTKTAITVSAK